MNKIVTHSGSFHADDVFAAAAFQLLLGEENCEIIRTRDEAVIAEGDYVVDVGGVYDPAQKRFDHHQNGAPVRENGIPYAGFGLMWRHYGEEICGSAEVAQKIEEKLCVPVDASDNAIMLWETGRFELTPLEWDDIVKTWKALSGTDEDMDEQFLKVVTFVREYLERVIAKEQYKLEDRARAEALYAAAVDKSVIVTEVPVSRRWYIEYPDVQLVVHPRDEKDVAGAWMAMAVEVAETGYATKVVFPPEWWGLRDEDLVQASGIADAIFCHKTGYLFIAGSKEGALAAAKLAM